MQRPPCDLVQYVSTGQAAKALGVSTRSLQQWAKDGLIEPDFWTSGGHMRWDVDHVRAELRANLRNRRDAAEAEE